MSPETKGAKPQRCPCNSGETYAECCNRFHSGVANAPTAQTLMRSRFSAFAVGDGDYVLRTWDPSTRPPGIDLDDALRWMRLEIVETVAGGPFDTTGTVEFRAHYRTAGGPEVLHERSNFHRVEGRWFYLSGDVNEA